MATPSPSRLQLVLQKALHEVHTIQLLLVQDQQPSDVGGAPAPSSCHASSQTSPPSTSHPAPPPQTASPLHWTPIGVQRSLTSTHAAHASLQLSGLRRINVSLPPAHAPKPAASPSPSPSLLDTGRLSTFSNFSNDLFASDTQDVSSTPLMDPCPQGQAATTSWGTPATEWGSFQTATTPASALPTNFFQAAARTPPPPSPYAPLGRMRSLDAVTPGVRLPCTQPAPMSHLDKGGASPHTSTTAAGSGSGSVACMDPDLEAQPACAPIPSPSPRALCIGGGGPLQRRGVLQRSFSRAEAVQRPGGLHQCSSGARAWDQGAGKDGAKEQGGAGRAIPFASWRRSFDSAAAVVRRVAGAGGQATEGQAGTGGGRRSFSSHPLKENTAPAAAAVQAGAVQAPSLARRSSPSVSGVQPRQQQQQQGPALGARPSSDATGSRSLKALAAEKDRTAAVRKPLTALANSLQALGSRGAAKPALPALARLGAGAKEGRGSEAGNADSPRLRLKSVLRAQAESTAAFGGPAGEVLGMGVGL